MQCLAGFISGFGLAVLALAAQDAVTIDFRNRIPGVLDAPVFDADGVTRLSWDGSTAPAYVAQLFLGTDGMGESAFIPVGVPSPFQNDAKAGYWEPQMLTVPWVAPGVRILAQVRAVEYLTLIWTEQPTYGRWGKSKILSIVATNSPIRLIGLESFSLQPGLWARSEPGAVVLEWLHEGATTYQLEATDNMADTNSWRAVFTLPATRSPGTTMSYTNPIVSTHRFFRLKRSW